MRMPAAMLLGIACWLAVLTLSSLAFATEREAGAKSAPAVGGHAFEAEGEFSAAMLAPLELPAPEALQNPLAAPPSRARVPGGRPWPSAAVPATPGLAGADALGSAPGSIEAAAAAEASERPTWGGAKPGLLQRLTLYETWLASGGSQGMELHESSALVTAGIPFLSRDTPLLLTPGLTTRFTGGPDFPDVPPQLYDATFEIRHLRQLNPRWGMDLAVTPGVYSDFHHTGRGAFRLSGRGVAAYQWRPKTQFLLGVAYLNRGNLKMMPIGGFIWLPSDDWRIELLPPQPRFARRISASQKREWWAYVAGEFGGGVWAVERADGSDDLLTLNDLRVRVGMERFVFGGCKSVVEAGYVFARTLSYRSQAGDTDLDPTFMLRAGLAY